MLAAHEPFDDPRVDWAARTAAQFFETTVFGLQGYAGERPEREDAGAYRIRRFPRPRFLQAAFVMLLLRIAGGHVARRRAVPRERAAPPPPMRGASGWRPAEPPAIAGRASRSVLRRVRMLLATIRHVVVTAQVFSLQAMEAPDIAVVYCHDLDALLPGVLLAIARRIKVVYDSHEYWPYSNVEALGIQNRLFRIVEHVLSRRADAVLTVSEPLAQELKRAYGLLQVETVPNAEPWVDRVAEDGRSSSEIARLAAGRVSFLFQGSFAPERGLEELLEAWTGVDPAKAVLFLRGHDNRWRQALAERARRLGLLDRAVFILPAVAVTDLISAAREVDVGIIPYKPDSPAYRYACPNKLSQYMQGGLAILSNNIGYVADQITAAQCGVVYDGASRESIVTAVMRMAEDRAALDTWKRNALAYARSTFNWQVQSQPLVAILRRLAGPAGSSSLSAAAR
jgi:glycosyltransferase involved in cell wall biosynthesis